MYAICFNIEELCNVPTQFILFCMIVTMQSDCFTRENEPIFLCAGCVAYDAWTELLYII
jgi:hypothetical protein